MATVQEFEQFMTDLESFKDSLAEPDMKGSEREDYIRKKIQERASGGGESSIALGALDEFKVIS